MVPAGVIEGSVKQPGVFEVALDYAIPGYRDLKITRFVFQEKAALYTGQGIRLTETNPDSQAQAGYLR